MRLRIGFELAVVLVLAVLGYIGFSGTGLAAKKKEEPIAKMAAPPSKQAPPGMARIPAGCFMMGNHFPNEVRLVKDDVPVHKVCFAKDFYMDVYEVTNERYKACVDAGKCELQDNPEKTATRRHGYLSLPEFANFPVIHVDWYEAAALCAFEGKRLPTEAEWEYAARGGLEGKRYPWGDEILCTYSNWGNRDDYDRCSILGEGDHDTHRVGSYKPNGYGLYDMHGNVYEWVNDWYDKKYYQESPTENPRGPEKGKVKVYRGGGFNSPDSGQPMPTVSLRYADSPKAGNEGFRCAAD